MFPAWYQTTELMAANRRAVLAAGPWLWPPEPEKLPQAIRPGRCSDEPSYAVALLSCIGGGADLWRFPPEQGGLATAELTASARFALEHARQAVEQTVPALGDAVLSELAQQSQVSHLLCDHEGPASHIVGPSFGLGMGLALAAAVLKARFTKDFIAVAGLSPNGAVFDVDLENKLALLVQLPRRHCLLVAKSQEEEARCILTALGHAGWPVVGLEYLHEGIAEVLEPDFASLPARTAQTPAERGRLVRRMRFLVRRRPAAGSAWGPFGDCASAALREWGLEVPESTRFELKYVLAVARRHQPAGHSTADMPPVDWLRMVPPASRADVVANYLQQASDLRPETWRVLQPFVDEVLGQSTLNDDSARALGAIGRYLQSAVGREADALVSLARATEYWWEGTQFSEISWPLCALLRLAGALGERTILTEWSGRAEELLADGLVTALSTEYVRLALGTAWALCSDWLRAERHLAPVAAGSGWTSASALRWLAMGHRSGDLVSGTASELLRTRTDGESAWFQLLLDLDVALAAGDDGQSQLEALAAAKPHGLELLVQGVPRHERPVRVQRLYPY